TIFRSTAARTGRGTGSGAWSGSVGIQVGLPRRCSRFGGGALCRLPGLARTPRQSHPSPDGRRWPHPGSMPGTQKGRIAAALRVAARDPSRPGAGRRIARSALARLETRVRLADHEDLATATNDLAVAVTGLRRLQG